MPPQAPAQDPQALAKSMGIQVSPAGSSPDPADLARSMGVTITRTTTPQTPAPSQTPPPTTLSGPLGDAMTAGGKIHRAATGAIIDIARGFDPRTPEGRQNIVAGAGGAAVAHATGGLGAVPWIARILGAPLGAATGGMVAEAGEQAAGTKPVSGQAVAGAGITQAAYEIGGKMILWPVKALASRFVAVPRIARQAKDAVEQGVRTAKTAATELVDDAREAGRRFLTGERAAAQQQVRTAQRAAALDVETATMKGERELADARAIYEDLIRDTAPGGGDRAAVTRAVNPRDTPQLPKSAAQRALDALGAKVGEAAQTGPAIDVGPVLQALDQMAAQARPAALFTKAGGKTPDQGQIGFLQTIKQKLEARNPIAASIEPGKPGAILHGDLAAINKAIAEELGVSEQHPLPGILGKIAQLTPGTQMSFADAHATKKLLDESVNFERVASKHVEQITKGLRQVLREQLSVHKPYNDATEAFARTVPLYRRGVGKQLIKQAIEDPDKAVRVLKADQPARAAAVKQLLLEQSAAGGDAAQGRQAWQALQAQYVYDHIILGGPENLSQRLAKTLTEAPEFSRIVLGDETAQRVLSNIDHIGQAYKRAEQQVGDALLLAKDAAKAKVTAAKDAGARRVTDAQTAAADSRRVAARTGQAQVEQAQATARDFARSRVARHARPIDEEFTGLDVARAVALPNTVSGVLAILRLMAGPRRDEIIQWAAHSDQNTKRLVGALNAQLPATAVADLARELAAIATPPAPPQSATPSPAPSRRAPGAVPTARPANSATLPPSK